jgi:hydrogenase/urease accessory protein HupE
MNSVRSGFAGIMLLWLPGVAAAHSPIKGLDNFYAGLLHPVFVPAHLLSVLALGIFFGQRGPKRVQAAIIAFLGATFLGLAATAVAIPVSVELPLLIGAGVTGGLVALDRQLPLAVCVVLAAVLGLMIGFDSAQPQLFGRAWLAAMLGSGIAVYLLLLYAMVFADWFGKRSWQRIGLRVLGSWAVASALLVLSLAFVAA